MAEGRLRTTGIAHQLPFGDAPAGYDLLHTPERPPTIQFVYG